MATLDKPAFDGQKGRPPPNADHGRTNDYFSNGGYTSAQTDYLVQRYQYDFADYPPHPRSAPPDPSAELVRRERNLPDLNMDAPDGTNSSERKQNAVEAQASAKTVPPARPRMPEHHEIPTFRRPSPSPEDIDVRRPPYGSDLLDAYNKNYQALPRQPRPQSPEEIIILPRPSERPPPQTLSQEEDVVIRRRPRRASPSAEPPRPSHAEQIITSGREIENYDHDDPDLHETSDITPAPRPRHFPEYVRVIPPRRKYGPVEFERFDHLIASHANVGGSTLDKVKVDCKLLFSKTKWGTLGAGSPWFSSEVPAGIIYMDLVFDQPKDCKLSSATVFVTLDDQSPALDQFRKLKPQSRRVEIQEHANGTRTETVIEEYGVPQIRPRPVQIADWFGPKAITGRERTVGLGEQLQIQPTLGFAGVNIGGIGYNRGSTKSRPSRWSFSGQVIAGDSGVKHHQENGSGREYLYKGLRWNLMENDLEPQAAHSAVMHTAFAFVHDNEPVILRIHIEGKLKGLGSRARNKFLQFPKNMRGNDNSVSTLINLTDQHAFVLPLDEQARGLELEMQMANLAANPIEIPDPMLATFRNVSPIPRSSNENSSESIASVRSGGILRKLTGLKETLSKYDEAIPSQKADPAINNKNMNIRSTQNIHEDAEVPGPTVEDLVRGFSEVAALTRQLPPRTKGFRASSAVKLPQTAYGDSDVRKPSSPDLGARELLARDSSLSPLSVLTQQGSTIVALWNWILLWIFAVMPARERQNDR